MRTLFFFIVNEQNELSNLEIIFVNNTDISIVDTEPEVTEASTTIEPTISKSITYKTNKQNAVPKRKSNMNKRGISYYI